MSDTTSWPTTYLDLPTCDGEPMGETEAHGLEMTEYLRDILRDYFASEALVYVASNNFVYYDPSDVKKSVCPDGYVIKGIEKKVRPSYQCWTEGGALPCLVFELTSQSTWRSDTVYKRGLYQSWGCHEYFLYDLTADKIPGHLLGYRLMDGVYQLLEKDNAGRLFSEELRLELAHTNGHLRFFYPGENDPLPTRFERAEQAERNLTRAEAEREQQRLRAEQAEDKEEVMRQRAESAEDELRRLKEELARLKGDSD